MLPKVKIALPKYVKPAPVAAAPAADKKGKLGGGPSPCLTLV